MRIVVLAVASWGAALVVVTGLFVALVRGGGGTEAAPLPAAPSAALPEVALPVQRAGSDAPDYSRT